MNQAYLRRIGAWECLYLQDCQNTLNVATHPMSFPSLKQSLIHLMHYHRIFSLHLLWHSTTGGKNIFKLLAISQSCQFQLFLTDLLLNFWKIAQLLGKVKNTVGLRFISFSFSRKKKWFSERTCAYWQWIVCTMTGNNHMVQRCCLNNYIHHF